MANFEKGDLSPDRFRGPGDVAVDVQEKSRAKSPVKKEKSLDLRTADDDTEDNTDKYSAAKSWLFAKLGKGGLVVIKHGRHGRPKSRRLQCDFSVSRLFCRTDSVYKEILISDIVSIRRGTDVDPISNLHPAFAAESHPGRSPSPARRNSSMPFRRKQTILDQPDVLFGSANLRRYCRQQDMPLCVCLVTDDRTFDIQFMNLSDATEFYEHISVMVSQNVSTRPPSLGLARTASEEAAAASAGPGGVGYSPDIIVPDVLVDDDVHAALDVEFLLEQGFTEDQIMMMCEGIREEALLRSKKTEKIRKSLRVQRPLDVEQEMAGGAKAGAGASPGEGAHMTDDEDDLSPEDKAAVADLIREKGYTEEQALQVHLQTLFTADELAIAIQSPAIEKQAIVEASGSELNV